MQLEEDVLADHPAQHPAQFLNHPVQVNRPHGQHLLAAEGQELVGQDGRLLSGLLDYRNILDQTAFPGQRPLHQLAVADDHRKNVVEIMGNAPGKAADGFHLLDLVELLLQFLLLFLRLFPGGNVPDHMDQTGQAVVFVKLGQGLDLNMLVEKGLIHLAG